MRGFLRWLCWWRPPCMLETVIVNRTDDPTTALRGVLWSSRGAWLTLRQVQALTVGEKPVVVDGEVIIHRSKVSFMQQLPAELPRERET